MYARLGERTQRSLRFAPAVDEPGPAPDEAWDRSMECVDATVGELERDGWLVNQTRMWLASQWTVRHGLDWRRGEDRFFAQLLDGSRAANRLGWQWTIGAGTGKPYGFSRWQVEKRAPELCERCAHRNACPVEDWPAERALIPVDEDRRLRNDPDIDATAGPLDVQTTAAPEVVWLTAESLGDGDPALAAHPDLPVVFVFDESLLRRLQLASKRLVFLTERLAELAMAREVEVHLGDPAVVLAGRKLATTFTPVPKARRLRARARCRRTPSVAVAGATHVRIGPELLGVASQHLSITTASPMSQTDRIRRCGSSLGAWQTGAMTRLFVAVWPPDDVLDRFADIERPKDQGVKWVPQENLHITLRFLGDADVDEVSDRLDGVLLPAATAVLGPAFDLLGERSLVTPVAGVDDLAAVVQQAVRGLGTERERKRFQGHITVARLARTCPSDAKRWPTIRRHVRGRRGRPRRQHPPRHRRGLRNRGHLADPLTDKLAEWRANASPRAATSSGWSGTPARSSTDAGCSSPVPPVSTTPT